MGYVRKIDNRNKWYGTYKYQLKISTFVYSDVTAWRGISSIKSWLIDTYGPEYTIANDVPYWCKIRNSKWLTERPSPRKAPVLYLKDDAELSMFLMRWS